MYLKFLFVCLFAVKAMYFFNKASLTSSFCFPSIPSLFIVLITSSMKMIQKTWNFYMYKTCRHDRLSFYKCYLHIYLISILLLSHPNALLVFLLYNDSINIYKCVDLQKGFCYYNFIYTLLNFLNDQIFCKSNFTSNYYIQIKREWHCRLRYFLKNYLW